MCKKLYPTKIIRLLVDGLPASQMWTTAGTASLLVSLPTVLVGVVKYARRGAFTDRAALSNTIAPMGVGSVIGAFVGGMLVGVVPATVLKVTLGVILNVSAFRVFHKAKSQD